jgi:hypothetical protein
MLAADKHDLIAQASAQSSRGIAAKYARMEEALWRISDDELAEPTCTEVPDEARLALAFDPLRTPARA